MIFNKNRLFIFSQSTSVEELISVFLKVNNINDFIICLSTHGLFEEEINKIKGSINNKIIFRSFSDLLSDAEMENCDIRADEYIVNTYKHRQIDLLGEYYRQIMILKNQTVKNNLERMYKISNCHILNSDLGIDRSTWESAYSNKTIL